MPDRTRSGRARARAGIRRGAVALAALLALLLATAFVLIAVAVTTRWAPLFTLDTTVEPAVHTISTANPALVTLAEVVSALGSPVAMNLVTLVGVLALLRARRVRIAVYLGLVRLIALGFETAVKALVGRLRPVWVDPVAVATSSSFPSGHSAGTAAVVLALTLLGIRVIGWPQGTGARAAAYAGLGLGVLLLLAVPASRVVLGVHYPSDVTAGLLLGAVTALALLPVTSTDADRARS